MIEDVVQIEVKDFGEFRDLYKEVFGFRPCPEYMNFLDGLSDVALEAEWNWLVAQVKSKQIRQAEQYQLAIKAFEDRVAGAINYGARDRKTAIRWLMEASEANTIDELHFIFSLPFGYLNK